VLLNNGAQTETRDIHGRTPLYLAADNGRIDVLRALVYAGADVGAFDYNGYSPLCMAAQQGHKDAVMTLIRHGADEIPSVYEHHDPLSVTLMWCKNNVEEILELLLDNGSSVHGTNDHALLSAAIRGRLDIVKVLVKYGADIHERDFYNMQPSDVASYCGHTDIVKFLSSSNSSTTTSPCYNLYRTFSVHCDTAMYMANLTNDLQHEILILEKTADVEAENVDGLRPIHCAVRTGLVELVELLVQLGANVDAADVFGNRPLHEAVCQGLNVVQLLVQRGAKMNAQTIDGKTPLHIAVERQQSEVILFLLSQDADVGLTDVWRNTPLHYFTSELYAVSGVAESVGKVLSTKRQQFLMRNIVGVSVSMHTNIYGNSGSQCNEVEHPSCDNVVNVATSSNEHMTKIHNFFLSRESRR